VLSDYIPTLTIWSKFIYQVIINFILLDVILDVILDVAWYGFNLRFSLKDVTQLKSHIDLNLGIFRFVSFMESF